MKIVKNVERIQRFQQGGPAPMPQDPAQQSAAQPQGQDPLLQIAEIMAQGLQTQNCELLAQGAQAFLMLLQQAQGGAEQQAPVGEPQGEPVFKKGGKICGRKKVKKDCNGGKVAKNCGGGSFKKCNGGTMKK